MRLCLFGFVKEPIPVGKYHFSVEQQRMELHENLVELTGKKPNC
jgi:hypothetical protein